MTHAVPQALSKLLLSIDQPQAGLKLLLSIDQPQAVLKLLLSIDQPQAGLLYVESLPNNLDEAPQIRSAYDYAETRFNDVATFDGFLQTIILVLRVKEKGLLHVGMPCSSFVWISRSRHRRTAEAPFGDETQPNVLKANEILGRVALLLVLATVRKIWWLIEQPKSSMLPYCPNVRAVMAMAGNVVPTVLHGLLGPLVPKTQPKSGHGDVAADTAVQGQKAGCDKNGK